MSSYIYIIAPFALGIILAFCSSAYCIYIRYSKKKLVEKVRAQMLARIIYGQDAETERDIRMDASDMKKFHTEVSNAPRSHWEHNYRNSQMHSNPTANDRSEYPREVSERSDSLLYLNMPRAPRRPSSRLSYDLKQQTRGQYSCETKGNATKSLRTSGKNRPGQGQRVYENAEVQKYQQSNLTNPRYNNYAPPDTNVRYQRGS